MPSAAHVVTMQGVVLCVSQHMEEIPYKVTLNYKTYVKEIFLLLHNHGAMLREAILAFISLSEQFSFLITT